MLLLLLRWRWALGVRLEEAGLQILGPLVAQSSELLSLLLPSSPQLEKSSFRLISSNNILMLAHS